jgi:hypothetical protein
MTLHRDRARTKKLRPPMPRATFIIVVSLVVIVLATVITVVAVSGRSFF